MKPTLSVTGLQPHMLPRQQSVSDRYPTSRDVTTSTFTNPSLTMTLLENNTASYTQSFISSNHNSLSFRKHRRQLVSSGFTSLPWTRDLHCPAETPPGVLHLSLESSAKEGHALVGESPNKDHNDQGARIPLLWGKIKIIGIVQTGEEKAPESIYNSFPIPNGAWKKAGLFIGACSDRTRVNSFKLKEGRLD